MKTESDIIFKQTDKMVSSRLSIEEIGVTLELCLVQYVRSTVKMEKEKAVCL